MKQKSFLCAALVALFASSLIIGMDNLDEINKSKKHHKKIYSKNFLKLHDKMRKIWEDHIQWTRNYIISAIANLGDQGPVAQRLLQNQDDLGDAIKPYFGRKIGNRLTKLFIDHILIAVDIIADAIANNIPQFEADYAKWQKNARRIAEFLHKHNSHWSKEEFKKMLYEHLDLTACEVASRLQADWQADINCYDEGHTHALKIADMFTKGIVKEFPCRF